MLLLLLTCGTTSLPAMTWNDFRNDRTLTPENLIRKFANFKFKLFDAVQSRDTFLSTQIGDCDDFATLAADALREKGYTTKLVAVFTAKQAHVVCYVKEAGAYLDYNNRKKPSPLVPTDGSLADIARKVARSFGAPWCSVLEYTFKNGVKRAVATDFPQA